MATVDRSNWQAAADLLSKAIHGQPARLEVASKRLGDQIEADWAALQAVSYDPRHDQFEIQLEGLDHWVSHPRLFAVREKGGLTDSLMLVDGDGAEHIVQLREPIALPPPQV